MLELSLPEQWAERERLAELDPRLELAAGIVDVKSPHVQTPDELRPHLEALLRIVPAERLLVCPSCGLGRRPVELAIAKTTAMVAAARRM